MVDLEDVLIVLKDWEVVCTSTHPLREFLERHRVMISEETMSETPKSLIYCKLEKGYQLIKRQHPAIDHVYKKGDRLIKRHLSNELIEKALDSLNKSILNQTNLLEEVSQEEVDNLFDSYRGKNV
ncbi:hypothetical protein HY837_02130 [archaeon]|nr:hypothetical protein [archaeon]